MKMNAFDKKLNGLLYGLMQWSDWDAMRERLLAAPDKRWFVYAVGDSLPERPLPASGFKTALAEIDALLRRDHGEDYLGIVYADDLEYPSLVKIYDPNNLGSACGSSGHKVAPGWILSTDPPNAVEISTPLPGNRRRWWDALKARFAIAS